MNMKKAMMAMLAGVALLAACSADETDFKDSAEKFIQSDTVEQQLGTTFTDAECTKPAKVEAGETFTCTAKDSTGATWTFDLVVKDKSNFEVVSGQPKG
jgi:ABC-type glycerol-3-phosphate transport system substrate-binding protein